MVVVLYLWKLTYKLLMKNQLQWNFKILKTFAYFVIVQNLLNSIGMNVTVYHALI